jgi:hypothetical protein
MGRRKDERSRKKRAARSAGQVGKYNNRRTVIDGIVFASQAEGERYLQLRDLVSRGEIQHFRIHPTYRLFPSFRDRLGRRHRATNYTADFAYVIIEENGVRRFIVEDVKGPRPRDYVLRTKLFQLIYPFFEFYEVDARRLRRRHKR